jgi:hypothetical protein
MATCCPPTDVEPGGKGIAPEWNAEGGGETLFYNSNMDAEIAVAPKPGWLVVFDGNITHVGRPPYRICYAPRYALAFKLNRPHRDVRAPSRSCFAR